jgi:hypothetical protein
VGEDGRTVPGEEGSGGEEYRRANSEAARGHTSRLERRIEALRRRQRQPEPNTPLKLLTTDELRRALVLIERAEVLPSGDVRHPEAFQAASPEEREALERWSRLCGEPLDHLEAAEELLDRMGEAHGWHSPEAVNAALLLQRLERPDESPWFVAKRAEAVLNFYAELDEHRDEPRHPRARGAVRRLERLEEINRLAPERGSALEEDGAPEELEEPPAQEQEPSERLSEAPQEAPQGTADTAPRPGAQAASEGMREPWWRRWFGGQRARDDGSGEASQRGRERGE